jgi:FolB domain-containing protein
MQGTIHIENLKIRCIIGVNPQERQIEQEIFIDAKVKYDITKCITTDKVEEATDYIMLARVLTELAQARKFYLLETFAAEASKALFKQFNVQWVWLKVKKPKGVPNAEYACIEVQQSREEAL